MKLHSVFTALWFLLFVFIPPLTMGDLNSDKQALLDFAAVIPHGREFNWNASTAICKSWEGIACNLNGTRVHALRLPFMGLYGPVPANTIGKLDALTILSLRSNFLSGNLPSDILSLPSLNLIYLQNNNFSGVIPSTISPNLRFLDLSFNSLTGNIPITIRNLTHLTGISLQHNSLIGPIPDINLPKLKHINFSYNHLNGSIPVAIQMYPVWSFKGNIMLCGPPLNQCTSITPTPSPSPSNSALLPSSPPKAREKSKLSTGVIIAIAVGGSALLLLVVPIIIFCCFKTKNSTSENTSNAKTIGGGRGEKPKEDFGSGVQEAEKNKLVFFGGSSYNFDLEDLLRASAEVLGKGSYGTAYKAILEEGTTVVVKRLKDVVMGKKDFEQQMENVGRIGVHPNVVPLRAYYYSKDEKLLVYDYVPAGSLSTLLHASRDTGRTPLDWESRLKICLGTAKGIAFIHSAGTGKSTHGNIKSSNVLLTDDLNGCISDFGLTPLMNFPTVPSRSSGYRAPEVIQTKKFTHKSDVYSFGVLLLEMLTGKVPVQSPGNDDVIDLPIWVQSVVREEWTAEVFDVELMKAADIEEELVQMLQIAMSCVAKVADMRPKMEEVVQMIEDIQPAGSTAQLSPEENKAAADDSNIETESHRVTSELTLA